MPEEQVVVRKLLQVTDATRVQRTVPDDAFWNALNGRPKAAQSVPGLDYQEGAGYRANIHPALRYALMVIVELDNTLSYLQSAFQVMMAGVCGAVIHLGKAKTAGPR